MEDQNPGTKARLTAASRKAKHGVWEDYVTSDDECAYGADLFLHTIMLHEFYGLS